MLKRQKMKAVFVSYNQAFKDEILDIMLKAGVKAIQTGRRLQVEVHVVVTLTLVTTPGQPLTLQ